MASLVNKKALKQFILDRTKALKPSWNAERVSGESLAFAEARLKNIIDESIRRHPTIGKTVKLD